MKANYLLLILLQVIYLTNCEESRKVNRISDSYLRELAKIAKVSQSGGSEPAKAAARLSRSFGRTNSRQSRIGEDASEQYGNGTVSNSTVGEERESDRSAVAEADAGPQPGRRESAGKRKQQPQFPEERPFPEPDAHFSLHNSENYADNGIT
ncbi:UNVERIFIED_CONTAM: hypothetical protein PYX00_008064 [Menopon gallinae]|uniref:Uncharacterized protein n=1 Tax=Menopon gallinae TaxID=328185 RepID=A0AAW2HLQ2_9NEOP